MISDLLARTLPLLTRLCQRRGDFDVALADLAGARAYSRSERAVEFGGSASSCIIAVTWLRRSSLVALVEIAAPFLATFG
jgi:hypothetical protein